MRTVLLVRRLAEIRGIHWHQSSMEHSFPSSGQLSPRFSDIDPFRVGHVCKIASSW